jgi:transposase
MLGSHFLWLACTRLSPRHGSASLGAACRLSLGGAGGHRGDKGVHNRCRHRCADVFGIDFGLDPRPDDEGVDQIEIADLEKIYQRSKAADKELTALLAATGTTLTDLHGIGTSGAARLLVEVGDIARFPSKAHFASWNGTAPLDASSGDQIRHGLSLQRQPADQPRHSHHGRQPTTHPDHRPHLLRPTSQRRQDLDGSRPSTQTAPSDAIYHQMILDAQRAGTSPGGQTGNDSVSSATGSQPNAGSSDKPLPGPVTSHPRTAALAAS